MSYLDPATLEYCDLCRCKTRHVPEPDSGEPRCEWHDHLVVHVERAPDAPAAVAEAHRLRRASAGH